MAAYEQMSISSVTGQDNYNIRWSIVERIILILILDVEYLSSNPDDVFLFNGG